MNKMMLHHGSKYRRHNGDTQLAFYTSNVKFIFVCGRVNVRANCKYIQISNFAMKKQFKILAS